MEAILNRRQLSANERWQMIPENPDTLLTRAALAAALTESGYPIAPGTLATRACRGGGPAYQKFGRIPLYRWGDSLSWARARLTPPRRAAGAAP